MSMAVDMHTAVEELLEAVFFMQSLLKLYNKHVLEVRENVT
jgi:hypothetical protein